MIEIRRQARWNPWLREDRAEELDAAETVFGQWRRAESDFRQPTWPEIEARMAAEDERFEAERRHRTAQREARRAAFDPQRSAARLTLLEYQARLRHALTQPGPGDPQAASSGDNAGPVDKAADAIAALERTIATLEKEIGDPETVVDEHGWLPAERRETALMEFRWWREDQVRSLRPSVSQLQARLADKTTPKTERSALRDQLRQDQRRLQVLEDLPPVAEAEMCSECPRPLDWHSYTSFGVLIGEIGPCLAWPQWAEKIRRIREHMVQWAKQNEKAAVLSPAAPKQAPLAVIPSKIPLSEVVERLSRIQAQHPDAEVRRGRRNSWEIWSGPEATDQP